MVENSKSVVIDTNLLVRYLTDDDPKKAKAVDVLLNRAGKGELRILIPSIVVAELVWVLESSYKMIADEIAKLVEAILNTPGIDVQDKRMIKAALSLHRAKQIDLIDAWIIEFAKAKGAKRIYTFDKKHFRNIRDIEIIEIISP